MKVRRLALIIFAAVMVAGCGPKVETAAWIVRDQLVQSDNIKAFCEEASEAGLDTLVVQVRGRGDAYYATDRAPRAESLIPLTEEERQELLAEDPDAWILDPEKIPEDPLADVVSHCGDKRLVAWLNVYYLWGGEKPPKGSDHPAISSPAWLLTDADGRSVAEYSMEERAKGWIEGIYADPASPQYRELFAGIAAEVARSYPVAGIHLDFVRYPGPAYGYGGLLGVAFRERYGFDPRWLPADFGTVDIESWLGDGGPEAEKLIITARLLWADLRAQQITKLVRRVRDRLDEVRPGVELSAAVVPDAHAAFIEKGQNWRSWLALGLLDAVFPMSYYGRPERVGAQLERVTAQTRALSPDSKVWAGLGAYIKEAVTIEEEAEIAAEAGVDGICIFDLGTVRESEKGLMPYAWALEQTKSEGGAVVETFPSVLFRDAPSPLEHAVVSSLRGDEKLPANWPDIVRERWEHYMEWGRSDILRAVTRLEREGVEVPGWRELSGVFRYIHPEDPEERKVEQLALCSEARERLVAGEPFEEVALELSQGGTKNQGGWLGRRYLSETNPYDIELAGVDVGALSPVLETSNGCWVYRVEKAGEAHKVAYDETTWEVRRKLFASALKKQLEIEYTRVTSRRKGNAHTTAPEQSR